MCLCVLQMADSLHHLPQTPSTSLNSYLRSHYSVSANTPQYVAGEVVCRFYQGASTLQGVLVQRGGVDVRVAWRVSCALVGVAVAVCAWLVFNIVISSTFIVHALLHYAAVVVAVIGLGLGAAGTLYFTDVTVDHAGDRNMEQRHSSKPGYTRSHTD